jgi:hypothetical protein
VADFDNTNSTRFVCDRTLIIPYSEMASRLGRLAASLSFCGQLTKTSGVAITFHCKLRNSYYGGYFKRDDLDFEGYSLLSCRMVGFGVSCVEPTIKLVSYLGKGKVVPVLI